MVLAVPLLSPAAGVILDPDVLPPFRHHLTARQIAHADQAFSQVGATREDLVVCAPEGVFLRGWKVRP